MNMISLGRVIIILMSLLTMFAQSACSNNTNDKQGVNLDYDSQKQQIFITIEAPAGVKIANVSLDISQNINIIKYEVSGFMTGAMKEDYGTLHAWRQMNANGDSKGSLILSISGGSGKAILKKVFLLDTNTNEILIDTNLPPSVNLEKGSGPIKPPKQDFAYIIILIIALILLSVLFLFRRKLRLSSRMKRLFKTSTAQPMSTSIKTEKPGEIQFDDLETVFEKSFGGSKIQDNTQSTLNKAAREVVHYELMIMSEEAKLGIKKIIEVHSKRFEVTIPAGITENTSIKLSNALCLANEKRGDILIQVKIKT